MSPDLKKGNRMLKDLEVVEYDPTKECPCVHWCDVNIQHRILTGHNENCPHSPSGLKSALALIAELAHGMEIWAEEEDTGIHSKVWEIYSRAKALECVFLATNSECTEYARMKMGQPERKRKMV